LDEIVTPKLLLLFGVAVMVPPAPLEATQLFRKVWPRFSAGLTTQLLASLTATSRLNRSLQL
jgi:hypothetical protein